MFELGWMPKRNVQKFCYKATWKGIDEVERINNTRQEVGALLHPNDI